MRHDCRVAFDSLAQALGQCYDEGVVGVLRVSGSPGGLFHFRKGVVVAVDSPGAPGAEALLLRSGRISEDDWTSALREAAENRAHGVDLAARGGVGVAELRAVALMAALDGAFAIAAGTIDGLTLDTTEDDAGDVPLPVAGGVDLHDLLWETVRRLDGLDGLPVLLSPFRERVAPVSGVSQEDLSARQRDVLAHATGRRNARDIAFAVGRGVYPVMVEISYLLARGVLEIAPATSKTTLPTRIESLRPRHAAAEQDLPPPREAGIYETEGKNSGL